MKDDDLHITNYWKDETENDSHLTNYWKDEIEYHDNMRLNSYTKQINYFPKKKYNKSIIDWKDEKKLDDMKEWIFKILGKIVDKYPSKKTLIKFLSLDNGRKLLRYVPSELQTEEIVTHAVKVNRDNIAYIKYLTLPLIMSLINNVGQDVIYHLPKGIMLKLKNNIK